MYKLFPLNFQIAFRIPYIREYAFISKFIIGQKQFKTNYNLFFIFAKYMTLGWSERSSTQKSLLF